MTDNEIIKALEEELKTALTINHRFEESNDTENPDDHKFIALLINTIKLINRQKAEIERLEAECGNQSTLWSQHYESIFETAKETIKAEAVKEFAERLKEKERPTFPLAMVIDVYEIDNLVKEMVGAESGN